MDAFSIAAELIPGIELTAGQLAQLRAVNHRYHTRLFELTRAHGAVRPSVRPSVRRDAPPVPREPTAAEASELRAMLVDAVLELLTPEQRRTIPE
jgi:hypothetical protein